MKRFADRIISTKAFLVFSLFFYRILLDLSYVYIVSPKYSYSGFILNVNNVKLLESYALLFVSSLFLKHRIKKPSDFFILFLYSMLVVPLLSTYSLLNKSREYLYMVLFSFLVIMVISKITQIKLPIIRNGNKFVVGISLFTGILLFSWIIFRGGLHYLNFNLLRVYDFRRTVSELIFPGKIAYLMTWFGKVMNPLFIAIALMKKNKTMFLFTIGIQILFFGITAHKAILFYPILIVFASILGEKKYFGQMIPIGLAGVIIFSTLHYYITDSLIMPSLFIRRVLYVTALNHYRYYDTFKQLGFLYLSNRAWFPQIIRYPYDLPVPQMISMIYNGHPNTWVNTGFLATGYINFGLSGMIVYSAIVGVIFRFIDYIAKYSLPMWLCIAIMVVPINSLLSGDLFTCLLTHGILIAMIMLWLMSSGSDGYKYLTTIN